ncbi:hypothetical protein G6F37_012741 [Rhizopus arrhizus]|nr:hypothetical protein G6F38_012722 [Rhizopus arrhizus]KAG1141869.1 hypothetical protein G6F37_012741 [Rhizopus arrhizus]
MRSVLVSFGLLSIFMLVSSLPLGPATLEKRQLSNTNDPLGILSNGSLSGVADALGSVTDTLGAVTDAVPGPDALGGVPGALPDTFAPAAPAAAF